MTGWREGGRKGRKGGGGDTSGRLITILTSDTHTGFSHHAFVPFPRHNHSPEDRLLRPGPGFLHKLDALQMCEKPHQQPQTPAHGRIWKPTVQVNFSWETVEPPVRRSDVSVLLTGPWRAIGPCSPSGAITSAPYIYETLAFSFFHTIFFLYWFAQFLFPTIPCCISFPLLSLFLCFSFLNTKFLQHIVQLMCHYKIMLENIYFNTEMKWYQGMWSKYSTAVENIIWERES